MKSDFHAGKALLHPIFRSYHTDSYLLLERLCKLNLNLYVHSSVAIQNVNRLACFTLLENKNYFRAPAWRKLLLCSKGALEKYERSRTQEREFYRIIRLRGVFILTISVMSMFLFSWSFKSVSNFEPTAKHSLKLSKN